MWRPGGFAMLAKRLRQVTVCALIAIGGSLIGSSAAYAENNTRYWSNNGYAGFCGSASGGLVAAAQAAVFARNGSPSNYLIDGQFGQQSYNEIDAFQVQNGLAADGCAGPATWAALQNGLYKTTFYGQHPNLTLPGVNGLFANFDYTQYSIGCYWTYINEGGAPEHGTSGSIARYQYYRFLGGSFATYSPSNQHLGCY